VHNYLYALLFGGGGRILFLVFTPSLSALVSNMPNTALDTALTLATPQHVRYAGRVFCSPVGMHIVVGM